MNRFRKIMTSAKPLVLSAAFVLAVSCNGTSSGTNTVLGSTAVGAGTGAAIGSLAGGGEGAAIGALAGAAVGAGTGAAVNAHNQGQTAYPIASRDPNDPNVVFSPFDGTRLGTQGRPTGSRMKDPYGRIFVIGN